MPEPRGFEVLARETAFRGYFRITRYTVRHTRFAGGWSAPLTREVFERGHAALVLPYDPVRDAVVLIEQFRAGAIDAPGGAWLLEPVAGMIEEGESPQDVARREAIEEAGLAIGELFPIADCLVSPGGTSERHILFCGRIDAADAGGLFGLAEEGEDIRAQVLDFADAMALVEQSKTCAASLLIALQWLALNRTRVRARWSG